MKPQKPEDFGAGLVMTLTRLEELHGELAVQVDRKIERMREADTEGINECVACEQDLMRRIGEQEGLRRLLTDRLGRSYGMSPQKARRLTVAELAERLSPPHRANLIAVAQRLKKLATRVERRNRVAGALGATMVKHLGCVLSTLTASPPRAGAYSPGGGKVGAAPQRLFETVG